MSAETETPDHGGRPATTAGPGIRSAQHLPQLPAQHPGATSSATDPGRGRPHRPQAGGTQGAPPPPDPRPPCGGGTYFCTWSGGWSGSWGSLAGRPSAPCHGTWGQLRKLRHPQNPRPHRECRPTREPHSGPSSGRSRQAAGAYSPSASLRFGSTGPSPNPRRGTCSARWVPGGGGSKGRRVRPVPDGARFGEEPCTGNGAGPGAPVSSRDGMPVPRVSSRDESLGVGESSRDETADAWNCWVSSRRISRAFALVMSSTRRCS